MSRLAVETLDKINTLAKLHDQVMVTENLIDEELKESTNGMFIMCSSAGTDRYAFQMCHMSGTGEEAYAMLEQIADADSIKLGLKFVGEDGEACHTYYFEIAGVKGCVIIHYYDRKVGEQR